MTRGNALARLLRPARATAASRARPCSLPSGADHAGGRARARRRGARRCSSTGRSRRVARPRRAGRRPGPRHLGASPPARSALALATGVPVELGSARVARPERAARRARTVLVAGARVRRRGEAEISAPGVGLVTSEPGRERGRQRPVRRRQRLERRSRAGRRWAAALVAERGRISTQPACAGRSSRRGAPLGRGGVGGAARRSAGRRARRARRRAARRRLRRDRRARRAGVGTRRRCATSRATRWSCGSLPAAGRRRSHASTVGRGAFALQPGGPGVVRLTSRSRAAPTPPAALEGAVRARRRPRQRRLRIPWTSPSRSAAAPVCSRRRALDARVQRRRTPPRPCSRSSPAASTERRSARSCSRSTRSCSSCARGTAAASACSPRLRDLLPGRYAFGITGPRARAACGCRRGAYALRVVGGPGRGGPRRDRPDRADPVPGQVDSRASCEHARSSR